MARWSWDCNLLWGGTSGRAPGGPRPGGARAAARRSWLGVSQRECHSTRGWPAQMTLVVSATSVQNVERATELGGTVMADQRTPADAADPRDDLGRRVAVPRRVGRVVSLVPSLTEAVASCAPRILVGATNWCSHPGDLAVTRVGG